MVIKRGGGATKLDGGGQMKFYSYKTGAGREKF